MAAFLQGLFKDPDRDGKELIELVADYSRNVPHLLPALRDVINYGILYDQKIKVFLDLLKRERKRQKPSSGIEGYETDYPENTENLSVCSAETERSSPVRKKKKKKHVETDEIKGEIKSDETVIPKAGNDLSENAENVSSIEAGPPVKKKKKRKKKKEQTQYDSPLESGGSQLPLPNGSEVSNAAGENSSCDDVTPKNEAKEEADFNEDILINTVVGDQGICSTPASVSNTEKTPRKRHASEAGTPFRVIPSVQLMEDPARFPDLVPSPAEAPPPKTSSKPTKKCLVSLEFDSSVAQSGMLTAAEVCSALEEFGLKNIRVMQLEKSTIGSYFVKVEFLSTDFYRVASKFSGVHSSVEGVPKVIEVISFVDGQSPEGNPPLSELAAQATSLVGVPPPGEDQKALELNGGSESLGSDVLTSRADALAGEPMKLEAQPHESVGSSPNGSSQGTPISQNQKLIKRLLDQSTVDYVKAQVLETYGSKKYGCLFREWLALQKQSLPLNSCLDNGNVLFKPPKQWLNDFGEWIKQNHEASERNRGFLSSEGKLETGAEIHRVCPSTSGLMSPQSWPPSAESGTGRMYPQTGSIDMHHERPSSTSGATHGSVSPRSEGPSISSVYNSDAPLPHSGLDYRVALDERLFQLLVRTGIYHRYCVVPNKYLRVMNEYLPGDEHSSFLTWMDLEKEKIIENPSLVYTHVLFRSPRLWPEYFREWKTGKSKNLPPEMERSERRPRHHYGGRRITESRGSFRGRNMRRPSRGRPSRGRNMRRPSRGRNVV